MLVAERCRREHPVEIRAVASIYELLVTETGVDKLGKRGITPGEAQQLPRNLHVTVRNPAGPQGTERRLLIGRTDGGRALTLVVERP